MDETNGLMDSLSRAMGPQAFFLHPVPQSQQLGIYTPRQEIKGGKSINIDLWRCTNEKPPLTPQPNILQGSPPLVSCLHAQSLA